MTTVELGGQPFEYELTGEGPLVVAVRNVAAPAGMWPTPGDAQTLHDAGYALLTYRHLGTTDTIEGIAADVGRLIEHVERGPGVLWGWSQGAMTAQELALARPDVVAGAVMMATRGRLTAYDRFRYLVEPEMGSSKLGTMFAILLNQAADALCDDDRFERLLDGYTAAYEPDDEQQVLSARANRAGTAYGDPSRLDALRAIAVPCMVIAFSHDTNIPPVLNREVADAIPDCELVVIDGAGHSGGITHRVEIRERLLGFLRRL